MNRLVALLAVLAVPPSRAQDTARVVIVATTDVHGRVTHWDYENDREAPWGLTRAATVVDSLRRRYPGQVVLVDAGDLIQGNPFAAYFGTVQPVQPHPVIDALNALAYDVAAPGNHEFNFGLDLLERAVGDAAYAVVAGNIYRLPRDTLVYQRFVVIPRGEVRVGVTGFTTPGVMLWDRANVEGRVLVRPILPEAARTLARMDSAGLDLKVVLIHSGMGPGSSYDTTGIGAENVAGQLAALPVRPDLVVVGHSHRQIRDSVIDGVHFVQPESWAQGLAVAHVRLAKNAEGSWRVTSIVGEQIPLDNVAPDPVVTRRLQSAHEQVRTWVGTPLAEMEEEWSARYGRVEDTPIIDFVNEVQRRVSGAQLSATAAFNTQARFLPGAIRLRDVAALYPYENTLKVVRIDGATLVQYLEHSARYFHIFRPGEPVINESVPGYNFDMVSGVSYALDVSRPPGSRVTQLTYQGQLVQPTDTFTLALNNYRQSGGGGYDMLAGLRVLYDRPESIRDLLVDWVRRAGPLRAADYFTDSWRVIPPEAAAVARRAF